MPQVPRASRNFAPFIGSINPNKVVPDLVPLLILVLLGELFGTLEDVSTLGFASNLSSEKLRHLLKFCILNITLDLTVSLALRARFSACLFLLFRIVSGTAGSLPSTAILASENHPDDI